MSAPTPEQILIAERRAAESRARTRAAVFAFRRNTKHRIAEFNARIAQPSTLAWALAVGIVIGKTVLKRQPATPDMPRRRANDARGAKDVAAALIAVVSRIGWRVVSAAVTRAMAARVAAPAAAATSRPAPAPATAAPPMVHTATRRPGETVH